MVMFTIVNHQVGKWTSDFEVYNGLATLTRLFSTLKGMEFRK